MYLAHFGFKSFPFELPPNSDFLYLSASHKKALIYLRYALINKDNFTLISGEVGSGKTILLQRLLRSVPDTKHVVTLFQTQITPLDLLTIIAQQLKLNIGPGPYTKPLLYEKINTFMSREGGSSVIIVVDEAQRMPEETLEELRMLVGRSNHDKDSDVNIILCGQPELSQMVQLPQLEQLNQRIKLRYHLDALSLKETANYIAYRLKCVGCFANMFDADAIKLLYAFTRGLPRKINVLADAALTCAFSDDLKHISVQQIRDAAVELEWTNPKKTNHLREQALIASAKSKESLDSQESSEKKVATEGEVKGVVTKMDNIEKRLKNIEGHLEVIANSLQYLAADKFKKAH